MTSAIWKDGTVVYRGILGNISPEILAAEQAERLRELELRSHENVVLLSDYLEKSK